MSGPFTTTELALLEALERERETLLGQELGNRILLHEVSNCVMTLSAAAEFVEQVPSGSAIHREALQDIRRNASALTQLLGAFRLLTEETDRTPDIRSVDILLYLGTLIQDVCPPGSRDASRVRLEVRGGPSLWHLSPALLRTCFNNLLRNALRYSPEGATVRVIVGAGHGRQWLHVANPGEAIPAQLRSRLFQPGPKGGKGGMGVGLYVAMASISRIGGTIRVGSTSAGTVFSIVLPTLR
jgi:signal transduction histidine kinase